MNGSTHSLGRQASIDRSDRERNYSQGAVTIKTSTPTKQSGVLRKFKKSTMSRDSVFGIGAIPPHLPPEDLKICLEVIDNGVLDGHKRLCEALKKCYDDQFPLVCSLADVFVSYSVCSKNLTWPAGTFHVTLQLAWMLLDISSTFTITNSTTSLG
ncbi:hypothetical protein DL96DRAFT_731088 [Flagelloscypha sp. PMI_526]|nr:hypothetical protein DL96DRAFT_731088 [Flagelloscypha sp. PMI_526]